MSWLEMTMTYNQVHADEKAAVIEYARNRLKQSNQLIHCHAYSASTTDVCKQS